MSNLEELPFSEQARILDQVDEYTLYCFYTGIADLRPGVAYTSPIKPRDDKPSFVFFPTTKYEDCAYLWKDQALCESGGIFKLIKLRFGLASYREVYDLIVNDFALDGREKREGVSKVSLYDKPQISEIKIEINRIGLNEVGKRFWNQFKIDEDLLNYFQTTQISHHWTVVDGVPKIKTTYHPCFAYEIGSYCQLYAPYAPKAFKFRQDLPEDYFFGYLQLPTKGGPLVIDKSAKDTIFCKRIGLNAVAGKSETTLIPHHKMLELRERFDPIFLMLDNDSAGRKQTEKYMERYPFLLPKFLEEAKDKTDLCLLKGFDYTKETIYKLLEL